MTIDIGNAAGLALTMLLGAPSISIILSQPLVDVLDITIPLVEAAEGKDDGANLHAEHLSLIDIDSLTSGLTNGRN